MENLQGPNECRPLENSERYFRTIAWGGEANLHSEVLSLEESRLTPPEELTPPPEGSTPPPEGSTPPPNGTAPPEGSTPPPEGSTPPPNGTTPAPLANVRVTIAWIIGFSFVVMLIVIPWLIYWMLDLLRVDDGKATTLDRVAIVGSLQVGLGMYLGFIATYFGIAMTWIGVEAAFSLDASTKATAMEGQVALKSASPGIAFALLGLILTGVSLHKRIVFSEGNGFRPVTENELDIPTFCKPCFATLGYQ